jgi:phosphohistidine swiveling domain-containing protein
MNEITQNQRLYHFTKSIKLPSVILSPNDVFAFELLAEEPNYITMGSIIAPLVKEENIKEENMSGKVALIESADPGYDYLFSRQIGGLVTKFGGANSHMAIRCAELGIPAVIGLGEKRFSELMHYEIININCLSKQIKGQ